MNWPLTMALFTLAVFNIPVILLLARLPFVANLREALQEKGSIGGTSDTTSYSRITGMVGAVIITSFFWALGDIVIYKAFTQISDIGLIVRGVAPMFLVGSALFLPYAFNQIKSAFSAKGEAAVAVAAINAPKAALSASSPAALNLLVANLSSHIDDASFTAAVAAISLQVRRDFQPAWGATANLTASRMALSDPLVNIDAAVDAVIYVGDSSNDPTLGVGGTYGYHALNYGRLPYAFIYLDICAKYDEPWSCTLSHEILELLADPTTVLTATGPAPVGVGAVGQTVRYDLEVCDPTQGDTYTIDGVVVSNFCTRSYFGMAAASEPSNFLNLALSPFHVRPGGYIQYEDSTGAHLLNGPKVDAKRLAARAILGDYRRNVRRTEGLARHV